MFHLFINRPNNTAAPAIAEQAAESPAVSQNNHSTNTEPEEPNHQEAAGSASQSRVGPSVSPLASAAATTTASRFARHAEALQSREAAVLPNVSGLSIRDIINTRRRGAEENTLAQTGQPGQASPAPNVSAFAPPLQHISDQAQPSQHQANPPAQRAQEQGNHQAQKGSSHIRAVRSEPFGQQLRTPMPKVDKTLPIPQSNQPKHLAVAASYRMTQILEDEGRDVQFSDFPLLDDDVQSPGWFYKIPTRYLRYRDLQGNSHPISQDDPFAIQGIMQSLPFTPPRYWQDSCDGEAAMPYLQALAMDTNFEVRNFPAYVHSFLMRAGRHLRENANYRQCSVDLIRDVHRLMGAVFPDDQVEPSFLVDDNASLKTIIWELIEEAKSNCQDRFIFTMFNVRNLLFIHVLVKISERYAGVGSHSDAASSSGGGLPFLKKMRNEIGIMLNLAFGFYQLTRLDELATDWLVSNELNRHPESMYAFYVACSAVQDQLALPFRVPQNTFSALPGFNHQLVRSTFLPILQKEINALAFDRSNQANPYSEVMLAISNWQPWLRLVHGYVGTGLHSTTWLHEKHDLIQAQFEAGLMNEEQRDAEFREAGKEYREHHLSQYAGESFNMILIPRQDLFTEGYALPSKVRELLAHYFNQRS